MKSNTANGKFIFIVILILYTSFNSFSQPGELFPMEPYFFIAKIYENGERLNTVDKSEIQHLPFYRTKNIDSLNLFTVGGRVPYFSKSYDYYSRIKCKDCRTPCSFEWRTISCYHSFDGLDTFYVDSLYFEPGFFHIVPIKDAPPFVWNKINFTRCELQKLPSSDSLMFEKLIKKAEECFIDALKEKHYSIHRNSYMTDKLKNLFSSKCYIENANAIISSDQQIPDKYLQINSMIQSVLIQAYDYHLQLADSFFNSIMYRNARGEYRTALHYLPEKLYPKKQMEKIDSIYKGNKQELFAYTMMIADSSFSEAEKMHDSLWNLKDSLYVRAETYYREAGYYSKEHNDYLKQQYDRIDIMKRYLHKTMYADSHFKRYLGVGRISESNYVHIRACYLNSLRIMHGRTYPNVQLKKLELFYQKSK